MMADNSYRHTAHSCTPDIDFQVVLSSLGSVIQFRLQYKQLVLFWAIFIWDISVFPSRFKLLNPLCPGTGLKHWLMLRNDSAVHEVGKGNRPITYLKFESGGPYRF